MINNLPNGWKVEELGNCVDILDNQRIPLNNQDREERIKGKNLSELYPYYGATQQVGYIDDFIFNEELILLGEDGVMFYDRDKQKAYLISGKSWVNNHAHVLRARKNISINKYILNYLNIFHYKGYVSGATRLKLNQSRMSKIPIPIPPLQQQEKIVKVLDLTLNLIEKQKKLLEKYDLFLKSKFIEMFGDPIKNPMGWETNKIGNITKVKTGKTPSRKKSEYWENGTVNWAKTTEVNQSKLTYTEELITEQALNECKLIMFPKNTILIAMYGQGKTRGKVVLLDIETTINQAFGAILPNDNYNSIYLLKVLDLMYQDIRDLGRGGNQENLNMDIVKNISIILPPIELQNKFASIVEKIETIKEKENQKLKQMNDLHNSMMNKAFKGEID